MADETKIETVEEIKEEAKVKEQSEQPKEKKKKISPFVEEKDRFRIKVYYYQDEENKGLIVKDVDDSFDEDRDSDCIEFTFKHPSQGDIDILMSQVMGIVDENGGFDIRAMLKAEFRRILILLRDWDLDRDFSQESILKLDPDIVQGLIIGVREEIGMKGIVA